MLGAMAQCHEGAGMRGVIGGRGHDAAPQVAERELVAGAIRPTSSPSAEIMRRPQRGGPTSHLCRAIVLVTSLVITAAVYWCRRRHRPNGRRRPAAHPGRVPIRGQRGSAGPSSAPKSAIGAVSGRDVCLGGAAT